MVGADPLTDGTWWRRGTKVLLYREAEKGERGKEIFALIDTCRLFIGWRLIPVLFSIFHKVHFNPF